MFFIAFLFTSFVNIRIYELKTLCESMNRQKTPVTFCGGCQIQIIDRVEFPVVGSGVSQEFGE